MRRIPLSTEGLTIVLVLVTPFVFSVYLIDAFIWIQIVFLVPMLSLIVLLVIRKTNIDRIDKTNMLDAMEAQKKELKQSMEEESKQTRSDLAKQMVQFQKLMLTEFRDIREFRHRILEHIDPSYKRPKEVSLSASVSFGTPEVRGTLTVINPTRREVWRRRVVYALRWIWGTHNA